MHEPESKSIGQADSHRPGTAGRGFWAAAVALNVVMIGSTLQTPLYVLYQKRFGFSEIVLTLIYSVYMLGTLAALIFLGRVSDQAGRRRTMWPTLALVIAAVIVFIFAANVAMLFIARTLYGIAVGVATATVTAWLTELHPRHDNAMASLVASVDNLVGLGAGPILAGLLAQYAPMPLQLPYYVLLALLGVALAAVWISPETVQGQAGQISLRPRVGVPEGIRAAFVAPAATGFAVFALSGLFAALAPTLLGRRLNMHNHAVAGAVVFAFYAIGAIAEVLLRRLRSHVAMLIGLVSLLAAMALVVLSLPDRSFAILMGGTVLGGFALGMGFRGSLEVINQIAPAERRAEVLSSFFIVAYVGVAVPVIGVGLITRTANAFVADVTFAATIAALTGVAIVMGIRYRPRLG